VHAYWSTNVQKEISLHKVYAPLQRSKVRDVFYGPPGIFALLVVWIALWACSIECIIRLVSTPCQGKKRREYLIQIF